MYEAYQNIRHIKKFCLQYLKGKAKIEYLSNLCTENFPTEHYNFSFEK